MSTPFYKNVNTISLKFIKGFRNYKDVIKLIKDHFGLTKYELLAVGFAGRDSVHVRLMQIYFNKTLIYLNYSNFINFDIKLYN